MSRRALVLTLLAACGGCPWTDIKDFTVTPETSCLHLSVNTATPPADGGCVNPDVVGTNACDEPLVIPAVDVYDATSGTMQPLTIAPGGAVDFLVPLDVATYQPNNNDDRYEFSIAATLGGAPVTITFRGTLASVL